MRHPFQLAHACSVSGSTITITEAQGATGIAEAKVPMIFGRWESALVIEGTPIPVTLNEGLDWELELAVVIGRTTWAATEENATRPKRVIDKMFIEVAEASAGQVSQDASARRHWRLATWTRRPLTGSAAPNRWAAMELVAHSGHWNKQLQPTCETASGGICLLL